MLSYIGLIVLGFLTFDAGLLWLAHTSHMATEPNTYIAANIALLGASWVQHYFRKS